jgi:hypothetical protein
MDCLVVSTDMVLTLVVRKVLLPRVVFMSNFLCSTASATQKKRISIKQDLCCLTVLFTMPTAVELPQCTGIRGWGWPISSSMSRNIVACLQFRKRAPSLASTAEAMLNHNMAQRVKKAPFNLMGLVRSARQPMKKCPQALLWAFALERYDASKWMLRIMLDA